MRIRRRLQLLFVALFLVLLAGVVAEVGVEARRADVTETIDAQLLPARDELHRLLTSLVDQETGQRGYLLTGDDSFLGPYVEGRERAERSLDHLDDLLADERAAAAAVDRVRSRAGAWVQLAADFEIDAKRDGRGEVVQALVASGTGKRFFDQVRSEVDELDHLLAARLRTEQARADDLSGTLTAVRVGSVVAAFLLIALAGRLVARWVNQPLARLTAAVRAAAGGALRQPIPATGPPDLAELGADVDAMRRRLLAEVDDAARARAALADRGMIVVTLRDDLAPADVVLPDGVSLAGRFRPAKGLVAGDWYDARRLDDDRVALALVDVSGHGAEVATFALRTKALTMAAVAAHSPGEALGWVAEHLGETGELYLTGIVLELSASTGRVRYASAGHPPLLLAGLTGVEQLPATGPLLGPLPGSWTTEEAALDRGGVLVAYTDGLVELRDERGEQFDTERLAAVVAEHQLAGVARVADGILDTAHAFTPAQPADDITLCVVGR